MKLAERTTRIAGSPTMKVTATVDRLRRAGVEVIDFGAGEPDFPTPDAIKAAAHQALDANFTSYTPVAGIADLKRRSAIATGPTTASTTRRPRSSSPPAASRRSTTRRCRCSARATR